MLGYYQGNFKGFEWSWFFQPNDAIIFASVMWSQYYWWITMKAWMTWTKFMFFHPIIMYPFCEDEVGLKLKWWMTKEPWMTWMLFNSNMWSHCKGEVRSKNCWGITKEPWTTWKRQCFSTNDAITLLKQGGIKILLKDYQRALKDMVNVIKPNDVIILQMWGDVKIMLKITKEPWTTWRRLMSFHPTIM